MSGRDVVVRITADINDFKNKIRSVQNGLSTFSKEVQKSAEKRQAINDLGTSFGKMGLVAAGGAALAIRAFANFDQAMSSVKATGKDAANNINALRQAAIQAGADTKYSATEAAGAVENLAKAGISAADILGGGLKGSLDLAAAGQIDVAEAAQYAAIAMTQFNLEGKDIPHVADLLAAGAGKANGEVSDLGAALNQSGLIASQMGVSIEETTGSLAAFAQAGLLGSDAGTSFKTMLQRMANPSAESAKLMKALGVSAYNTKGEFIGVAELAGQLQKAFEGKTQAERDSAMGTIFGSDAIRAANVLYKNGKGGIDKWTASVNDAGYASKTAATKMDNLKGDWEKLTGSIETALVGTGGGANGPLRDLVQDVTKLVNVYGDLPAPIQSATLKALALTAAIGGTGFVVSRAITGYADMRNTLADLGVSFSAANKKALLMRGGLIATGVVLASKLPSLVGDLSDEIDILGKSTYGFSTQFNRDGKATARTVEDIAAALTSSPIGKHAQELGVNLSRLAEDMAKNGTKGEYYRETLEKLADVGGNAADRLGQTIKSPFGADWKKANDAEGALKNVGAEFDKLAEKQARVSEGMNDLAFDMLFADGKSNGLAVRLKALPAQVKTAVLTPGATDSIAEVTALAKKFKLTPDEVRTVMEASNFASDTIDKVVKDLGKVDKKKTTKLEVEAAQAERQTMILTASLRGLPKQVSTRISTKGAQSSKADVEALARALGETPRQVMSRLIAQDLASGKLKLVNGKLVTLDGKVARPKVRVDTSQVSGAVRRAQGLIDGMNGKTVRVAVTGGQGGITKADGGIVDYYADGGLRENHTAQIAPAGAWRMWAEPETGGESYIPLAASKRKRSLEIWQQTGHRLGVQGFADGAVVGGNSGTPTGFRITSGALRIEGGHAYVTGIAEAVYGGNEKHKASTGRRRGR